MIRIPDEMSMPTEKLNDLIQHVYAEPSMYHDTKYISERGILTPKNDTVDVINNKVMQKFQGEVCTSKDFNKHILPFASPKNGRCPKMQDNQSRLHVCKALGCHVGSSLGLS